MIVVSILAGCGSSTQTPDTAPSSNATLAAPAQLPSYQTQSECENAGGQWRANCVPNTPSCLMPYRDAGKQCADPSECESKMCIVDMVVECKLGEECRDPVRPKAGERAVGICKRTDESCGSYIEIKDGIAQDPYHID
jgi:hypothetical protein